MLNLLLKHSCQINKAVKRRAVLLPYQSGVVLQLEIDLESLGQMTQMEAFEKNANFFILR